MHTPTPVPNIYHNKIPTFTLCYIYEGSLRSVKSFENKNEHINLGGNLIRKCFGSSLQHRLPYMLCIGVKTQSDASVSGHELSSNLTLRCI